MGNDARLSKRRVLTTVDECVKLVNETLSLVEDVKALHNGLLTDLATKFTDINTRLDAQGSMFLGAEHNAEQLELKLTDLHLAVDKLDASTCRFVQIFGGVINGLGERVSDIEAFVAQVRSEADAFEALTFLGRVTWLVTGRYPRPLRPGEGVLAAVDDGLATEAYGDLARIPAPFDGTL